MTPFYSFHVKLCFACQDSNPSTFCSISSSSKSVLWPTEIISNTSWQQLELGYVAKTTKPSWYYNHKKERFEPLVCTLSEETPLFPQIQQITREPLLRKDPTKPIFIIIVSCNMTFLFVSSRIIAHASSQRLICYPLLPAPVPLHHHVLKISSFFLRLGIKIKRIKLLYEKNVER